ncbi:hypothetical protein BGX27_005671, partial [Mortierella sp. AM989]
MPNLKSLTLQVVNCDLDLTSGFAIMIRRNRNITKLDLTNIKTPDNSLFWKAVSCLPNLEELITKHQKLYGRGEYTDYKNQAKEIQTFWDACSKAKSVTLKYLCIVHNKQGVPLDPG